MQQPPGFKGRIGRTLKQSLPHWETREAPSGAQPNVVVILFDDLGYSDLGCFGGEIATPHLDALSKTGAPFSGYTTVPMCTPARAALLTGKNPHSVGCGWLTHNDPGYPGYRGEMSLDAPTMAELLRAQGYATLAAGKWHNTYDANARPGGDMRSWPLQRGFDRFYGFLGAETSYFQPDRMMEGNQPAAIDQFPADYFAPDDYTGRAVQWLADHHACSPQKPFFLYLAFQTPHTPLQAKPEDMRRYRGRYDAGWDAIRQERFSRQASMGLHEPGTVLAPRNPGVPDWETLPAAQRQLMARQMEIYAALVHNADENVGRVLEQLRQMDALNNTWIIVTSDNGANAVGGPQGAVNLQLRRQQLSEDPQRVMALLSEDRIGSQDTYAAYASGWTQVSNTPYRYYKRTPMAGGIRVPLIVHGPSVLQQQGQWRRQWVHVTDVLPTVLELTGSPYPEQFNGLRTRGMNGQSFASLLRDVSAPQSRTQQHYELQANRGFIQGEWKIVSLQAPRQPMQLDNWMLFNLKHDPAEVQDLAAQYPERVQELVRAFEEEAGDNYVYPLDHREDIRSVSLPPHELAAALKPRTFLPHTTWVPPQVISPLIADRSYTLEAHFDWQPGQEGVIVAIGDRHNGLSLFVMNGALHWVYQWWYSPTEIAPIALAAGAQSLRVDYTALAQREGRALISLNGQMKAQDVPMSPTMMRISSGGLSVGINRRESVSTRYADRGSFAYTGRIDRVSLTPGAQAPGSPLMQDEAQWQARLRESVD